MARGHTGLNGCVIVIVFAVLRSGVSEINVAISGTAQQSSNQDNSRWLAKQAVDGCVQTTITSGCCSHTLVTGPKTVWWRVDLGTLVTINAVTIYYRDNSQPRLAGYQLYVSNTTSSLQDGVLCYQDTSSTLTAVQLTITHQCPYVGRYVTVYNYRNTPKRYSWYSDDAVLELCEVQVWGCQVGTHGNGNCDRACSENCNGGNCNATTGACFCCIPQTYGTKCEQNCSANCKDKLCEKETGNCNECVAGKFGDTCDQDCPGNCKDMSCEKVSGDCTDCVPQTYGHKCEQYCSANCKDKLCQKETGNCNECVAGTYGSSCGQACSVNCKDRVCTKTTGHCIECVTGKFGDMCEQDCSVNCKDRLCVKDSGYCTECSLGKYGSSCDRDCPGYCRDGCTRDNASCIGCTTGRYGTTCTSTCPVTCKDFVCGQQTGQCLDCYPGKYGVVCGADCPVSCPDNMCNKEDGQCLTQDTSSTSRPTDSAPTDQSPVNTYVIIIAVLAVVCGLLAAALTTTVICQHRNRENGRNSQDKSTDHSGPDTGYSSIDHRDVEPSHVYEMVVTET